MATKVTCPNCGSENVIKKGKAKTKTATKQRWKCKDCGKYFTTELEKSKKTSKSTKKTTKKKPEIKVEAVTSDYGTDIGFGA